MTIDYPRPQQLDQLRYIWQEAFGDGDTFLDTFFGSVFSADRCRCITIGDQAVAALYWLDCRLDGRPLAYIYAVATRKSYRSEGMCRRLMTDTHSLLAELGYQGSILVPGEKNLFHMYGGMGYQACSGIREFFCEANDTPVAIRSISAAEYTQLRREYLPAGGVVQEGENMALLTSYARLYAGEDFLLAAVDNGSTLQGLELLGNAGAAPGILSALCRAGGTFRTPGEDCPFAMYRPISDSPAPRYFGLAFD